MTDPAPHLKKGVDLTKTCQTLQSDDDLVGAVIAELRAEGRLDNTILIFSGDNGMTAGEVRFRFAGKSGIEHDITIDNPRPRPRSITLTPEFVAIKERCLKLLTTATPALEAA